MLPDQGVTPSSSWAVVENIFQRQGELQAFCLRDVEVGTVVIMADAHEHLVLQGIGNVIFLWDANDR